MVINRMRAMGALGPARAEGISCRCCFVNQALLRSAADGLGIKNVFLYYNTDFSASFALAPSGADEKQSFVRYITDAGRDMR
jgi:hypothetical protein